MTVKAHYSGGHIVPSEPRKIEQYKATLKDGQALALTIEQWDERRHAGQQRLFHELLGRYARAMGESLESVKVRVKCDLGHWLPAEKILDGTHAPMWRGRFVDLHTVYPELHAPLTIAFVRSEADFTKHMEAEAIDYVLHMCESNGVHVEDIRQEFER